ncbi:MAG: NADH:flavin oxidoreductase [Chloroflexi bacterium]|nr:NADH:flavin oxidoreductase [Chloroflexota bacterium]
MKKGYSHIARIKTVEEFQSHIESMGVQIPLETEIIPAPAGPLAEPFNFKDGKKIGNRFCIQPMEGWDGTTDGRPTDLVFRRWRNFGLSGAKLIWGGEAAAVRPDGRANPNQLMIIDETMKEIELLRMALVQEHQDHFGQVDDLLVGLQLTHSGRFCRPNIKTKLEPKILYHHPLLDKIFNINSEYPVLTDGEIEDLISYYIRAAKRAQRIGFDFVDVKHCHGYLGHEFLSAVTRPGKYGGSFENRTRFMQEIVKGIKSECPELKIGVRFSSFDMPPFRPDEENIGQMMEYRDENGHYPYAFGGDPDVLGAIKLDEPIALMKLMEAIGVEMVNFSAASPYYNPHLTRPAFYPPSDGYLPPEDPIVGVARHIQIAAELKSSAPNLLTVGSGYSYLQDWIPNVAQAVVRQKMIDFVGLGRSTLSYPDLPADVLAGRPLVRNHICRTFSDCTTAPRKGMVSGCYPLDDFYKQRPEAEEVKRIKKTL